MQNMYGEKYSASAWSLHVRERNCPQDCWSDEKTGLGWKWKGVTGDPVHIGNDSKY